MVRYAEQGDSDPLISRVQQQENHPVVAKSKKRARRENTATSTLTRNGAKKKLNFQVYQLYNRIVHMAIGRTFASDPYFGVRLVSLSKVVTNDKGREWIYRNPVEDTYDSRQCLNANDLICNENLSPEKDNCTSLEAYSTGEVTPFSCLSQYAEDSVLGKTTLHALTREQKWWGQSHNPIDALILDAKKRHPESMLPAPNADPKKVSHFLTDHPTFLPLLRSVMIERMHIFFGNGCRMRSTLNRLNMRLIGAGTYGTVYSDRLRNTDGSTTPVAVKVCRATSLHNKANAQELECLRRLCPSQHVVDFKGVFWGPSSHQIGLVFKRENMNLHTWMQQVYGGEYQGLEEQLSPVRVGTRGKASECQYDGDRTRRLLSVFKHILEAMRYVHSKRIIHMDINPNNILLSGDWPVLCDFGMSSVQLPGIRTVKSIRCTGTSAVTLPYRAPEIAEWQLDYTSLVDIWSCGCVLYEMVNYGQVLFYVKLFKKSPNVSNDLLLKKQECVLASQSFRSSSGIKDVASQRLVKTLLKHSIVRKTARWSAHKLLKLFQ